MAKVDRLPIAERIHEEAAEWVARQDSAPLEADEAATFKAWLAASPAHAAAFERYSGLWRDFDGLASSSPPTSVSRSSSNWALPRIAAAIAVLILTAGSLIAMFAARPAEIGTEIGEQRSVILADGSKVTLNTGTSLIPEFTDDQRRVVMNKGEALFEVAHETARPFTVESRLGTIRAVGTKFMVRLDESGGLFVTVTGGKVLVAPSAQKSAGAPSVAALPAGFRARFTRGDRTVRKLPDEEIARALAWRQGDIIFEGESLKDAVAEMQRYTTRSLVVDPAVETYAVGGYFRTGDVDDFIETIEAIFPVRAIREGNEIRLIAKRA